MHDHSLAPINQARRECIGFGQRQFAVQHLEAAFKRSDSPGTQLITRFLDYDSVFRQRWSCPAEAALWERPFGVRAGVALFGFRGLPEFGQEEFGEQPNCRKQDDQHK